MHSLNYCTAAEPLRVTFCERERETPPMSDEGRKFVRHAPTRTLKRGRQRAHKPVNRAASVPARLHSTELFKNNPRYSTERMRALTHAKVFVIMGVIVWLCVYMRVCVCVCVAVNERMSE